jgi:uncharacterized protein (TIGR03435 family)
VKPSTGPATDALFCFDSCTPGERLSVTGSRVSIRYMSLFNLILTAWRIRSNQLSGPEWMKSERFDIEAKIPTDNSRDQVPGMLQSLLSDRFRLATHRDRKDQPVFALIVGRDGLKLEKAVAEAGASGPEAAGSGQVYPHYGESRETDNGDIVIANGFYGPMRPGRGGRGGNGVMQWEFQRLSMSALVSLPAPHVDRPVIDETNLTGSYRLVFQNVFPSAGPSRKTSGMPAEPGEAGTAARNDTYGEGLIRAIEKAGLKLEARKAPVEMIVVNHVEKSPTAN